MRASLRLRRPLTIPGATLRRNSGRAHARRRLTGSGNTTNGRRLRERGVACKPRIRVYPPETVIAEKYEAMVSLGIVNTRMKDGYDVWILSEFHAFDGATLAQAIAATFARRKTSTPAEPPVALTAVFGRDEAK